MSLVNFDSCPYSAKHGMYGGNAGDKDGVIYNDAEWIIKYPKTTVNMVGNNIASYTTSPLSEYIGSQIYKILGIPVHETILGTRHNRIVVACKDFATYPWVLMEVRTLKNIALADVNAATEKEQVTSATGDSVDLDELFVHFKYNSFLNTQQVIRRFWDCVLVDILIDNNDRNNGNWGLLKNIQSGITIIAPVFDNGNAFNNKTPDSTLESKLAVLDVNNIIGIRTAYSRGGKIISAKKLLNMQDETFTESKLRLVPLMTEKIQDIFSMIDNVPVEACSSIRKEYYKASLRIRLDNLLVPSLHGIRVNP